MIDIVYVLGKDSPWNDNELRYSLRSVEKYVSEYRNIYIIGELPYFLQNVIHIPFDDKHPEKETRIALKILRACQEDAISDYFLFMNDDHFILESFNTMKIPFYHQGSIIKEIENPILNHNYKQSLINTWKVIQNMEPNHPTYNFDVHTPIIYNKYLFYNFFRKFNWDIQYSYVIKSLYCNSLNLYGDELVEDCKILRKYDLTTLEALIYGKKFFSISDSAICDSLEQLLNNLFPEKSRYEK